MHKRRVYLLVIGVAVLAAVFATRNREPEYGGKRLSQWVEVGYTTAPQFWIPPWFLDGARAAPEAVDEAISHMGTNAVPYLLKWIRYEPAPWKRRFYTRVGPLLQRLNSSRSLSDKQMVRAEHAICALAAVGTNASGGIPTLAAIMNEAKAADAARRATSALDVLRGQLLVQASIAPLSDARSNDM